MFTVRIFQSSIAAQSFIYIEPLWDHFLHSPLLSKWVSLRKRQLRNLGSYSYILLSSSNKMPLYTAYLSLLPSLYNRKCISSLLWSTHLDSQQWGGRGKWISVISRLARPTQWFQGQPALYCEALEQNKAIIKNIFSLQCHLTPSRWLVGLVLIKRFTCTCHFFFFIGFFYLHLNKLHTLYNINLSTLLCNFLSSSLFFIISN